LLDVQFECLEVSRGAAQLFAARAMFYLGKGQVTEAEQDLLACHRLGRLSGQTPFVIPGLVAVAIDQIAFRGDAALIEFGGLSASAALAYQQELRNLPPLPVMAVAIDTSERFFFLDTVSLLARDRLTPSGALELFVSGPFKDFDKLFKASPRNWDAALVFGNEQFDKAVAAVRQPTVGARKRAFEQLDHDMRSLRSEYGPDQLISAITIAVARGEMTLLMGKVLTVLFVPALAPAAEAENRACTRVSLEQVAFALAAYHADHGSYPDSLSVLVPKYISRLPKDLYTEQPLHYRREDAGFLLYSVGRNGVDDGGRTFDSKPTGDDIVLKIAGDRRTKQ
jgi:hypothetical protein